ncbi:MAG: DUF4395 domain-containing protein [Chloroflexi bacterium]|nr:DUF4395 domain-containing protein [Chloroflexota bacterium]
MPLVQLNRAVLLLGVLVALLLQQPLLTTALLLLLLPSVLVSPAASPLAWVGRRLLASRLAGAPREAAELLRFNNTLAALLLGLAQLAFLAGLPLLGWVLAGLVALAAALALAGFCLGCVLFYQLRRLRASGR